MASNPYVNKVEFDGNTLIDLTSDTVDAAHLAEGYTAHDASGAPILGTMSGGGVVSTYYATCSTAASTAAKSITVSGWTPATGDMLAVLFSNANTAATPTLSINGTSYAIYIGTGTPNSTTNTLKWTGGTLLLFVFDGTYFRYISSRIQAAQVPPDGAGSWWSTSGTNAGTAAKVTAPNNFRLMTGARVSVLFTTANTLQSAITLNVNSTGAKTIYVNGAATSSSNPLLWEANTILTFVYNGSYWHVVSVSKPKMQGWTFVDSFDATAKSITVGECSELLFVAHVSNSAMKMSSVFPVAEMSATTWYKIGGAYRTAGTNSDVEMECSAVSGSGSTLALTLAVSAAYVNGGNVASTSFIRVYKR